MVEAIEELFHPVLVFNNKESDAATLERFGEPSWNNPVVRFLDGGARDVIPRRDRVWTIGATAARMVAALEAAERPAPPWLRLVAAEARADVETATVAMHCYWNGEARLGGLDGVVGTRVGWVDRKEVVEVRFLPDVVPFERLRARAAELDCASRVWAPGEARGAWRDAKESDDKFALRRAGLRALPLTPAQATKVNAALRLGEDADRWLSPRQRSLRARVLAASEGALDGFAPPDDVAALPGYVDRLGKALDG